MTTHPRGFALMTGGLRLGITMSSIINESSTAGGQSQCLRSARGARPVFMIS
jgi:hypothetical protein